MSNTESHKVMRFLFVDDDARLLQGLRQSLRGQRRLWEMEFVDNARAALDKLSSGPYDVVVSDIRMPGLDGAELLKRVRSMQPGALRVVLSGQMDDLAAARAATLAHRFLAKPIETDALVSLLRRTIELREQFQSDEMRNCIGGLSRLPSLPDSCVALNRALDSDRTPISQIAGIIERDVGMAAKVLQLVNSAFFGLPRVMVSVEQAVRYLGVGTVRSLVLANALFEQLSGGDRALLSAAQSRALLVASYARRFPLPTRQAEIVATAALLHNAGEVALISRLPDEHRKNLACARVNGWSVSQAERVRLGVTQAEIGAYLLSLWGLPFEVIEAVSAQQAPAEELRLLDPGAVIWMAKALALAAEPEALGTAPQAVLDTAARLGVSQVAVSIQSSIVTTTPERRAS